MSERQAGWYWVRCCANCRWEVAECHDTGEWSVMAPYEVGPRIPTPEESWQTVPVEATPDMMEASGYGASIETLEAWMEMLAAAPKP